MSIYEVMFYTDSSKDVPMICKMAEKDSKELRHGKSISSIYKIKLEIIQQGVKDDFIKNMNEALIVDSYTKMHIEEAIGKDVEFIACTGLDEQVYAVNILNVLEDALNREKSDYIVFDGDFPNVKVRGKIGVIWRTVLHKNKILGHIFRIRDFPRSIFVDDFFKQIIIDNNLKGIDFNQVETL